MAKQGMSTTGKVLLWTGVIATVGVSGYVAIKLFKRWKDKRDKEAQGIIDNSPAAQAGILATVFGNTPTTCKNCLKDASFPLSKGSRGKQVASVQYAYNKNFPTKKQLLVDGDWGGKSEEAFIDLFGVSSSFNGTWSNYLPNSAFTITTSPTAGSFGSGLGTSQTQSTSQKPIASVDKTKYDKYFKQYETI